MGNYSYSQIEQIWIQNGGNPAVAPLAAAIAMAESSGNASVTSGNPDGGTNVGLWQLDTPGGVGGGYSIAQLQDPNTNARVAINGSSNGTNWSAWETFVTGAYRQFLQGNVPPSSGNVTGRTGKDITTSGGGGSPFSWFNFISSGIIGNLLQPGSGYVGSGTSPLGPIGDLSQNFGALVYDLGQGMKWISWLFAPANWLRIGAFLVGIATFIGGLYMLKEAV